jgi:hypothetical protein
MIFFSFTFLFQKEFCGIEFYFITNSASSGRVDLGLTIWYTGRKAFHMHLICLLRH